MKDKLLQELNIGDYVIHKDLKYIGIYLGETTLKSKYLLPIDNNIGFLNRMYNEQYEIDNADYRIEHNEPDGFYKIDRIEIQFDEIEWTDSKRSSDSDYLIKLSEEQFINYFENNSYGEFYMQKLRELREELL